jgi:hypothetical protein
LSKSACRTREFAHNACLIKRGERGLSWAFFASGSLVLCDELTFTRYPEGPLEKRTLRNVKTSISSNEINAVEGWLSC